MGPWLASLSGLTSDMEYLQTLNLVYAILALLVFGTWYYKIICKTIPSPQKKTSVRIQFSYHYIHVFSRHWTAICHNHAD